MVVGPGKQAEKASPAGFHMHTGLRSINLVGEAGRGAGGGSDTAGTGAGGQEGRRDAASPLSMPVHVARCARLRLRKPLVGTRAASQNPAKGTFPSKHRIWVIKS